MTTAVTTPSAVVALQPWVDAGVFGPAEVHAAAIVADVARARAGHERVVLAFALAVWAPQHGHACIDLDTIAGIVDRAIAIAATDAGDGAADEPPCAAVAAAGRVARGAASAARLCARSPTVDGGTVLDDRPLVLFGRRVYTQRQWVDECAVAVALRSDGLRRSVEPTASLDVLLSRLLEERPACRRIDRDGGAASR